MSLSAIHLQHELPRSILNGNSSNQLEPSLDPFAN